jgi:hypothetical protein
MEELKKSIDDIKDLPTLDEIYPLLDLEAKAKNLQIFIFEQEELKEYFTPKFKEVAVAVISKNKDGAIWNIKNYRHSYFFRLADIVEEP